MDIYNKIDQSGTLNGSKLFSSNFNLKKYSQQVDLSDSNKE